MDRALIFNSLYFNSFRLFFDSCLQTRLILTAPAPLFVFNSDPRGFKDFTPIVPTEKTQNLRQEEPGEL